MEKKKNTVLIFTGLKVFQRLIFYFFADTLLDVEEAMFNTKGNCKERISDIGSSLKMCREDLVSGMARMVDITYKPICLPFYECMWLQLEFGPRMTV